VGDGQAGGVQSRLDRGGNLQGVRLEPDGAVDQLHVRRFRSILAVMDDFAEIQARPKTPKRPPTRIPWLLLTVAAVLAVQLFFLADRITDRVDAKIIETNRAAYKTWVKKHGTPDPAKPAYPELYEIMRRHNEVLGRHPEWNLNKYDLVE
jgi:hypothetical protein